jgi:DNA-binding HxlR family transcriptional regulator
MESFLTTLPQRSGCPVNLAMEVLGDRWSLVIIRDMMFGNRRYFGELLSQSMEGIATNILAARLKRLTEIGLITRSDDPLHKQKGIYSLTEMAIQLVPVITALGAWGRKHLPATEELSIRAQLLEEGGSDLWNEFMQELRGMHLIGAGVSSIAEEGKPTVLARLNDAYLEIARRNGTHVETSQ